MKLFLRLAMPWIRLTSCLAEGRTAGSSCKQLFKSSTHSTGHSCGTLHITCCVCRCSAGHAFCHLNMACSVDWHSLQVSQNLAICIHLSIDRVLLSAMQHQQAQLATVMVHGSATAYTVLKPVGRTLGLGSCLGAASHQ